MITFLLKTLLSAYHISNRNMKEKGAGILRFFKFSIVSNHEIPMYTRGLMNPAFNGIHYIYVFMSFLASTLSVYQLHREMLIKL